MNSLKKQGFRIEIHSSRAKANEDSLLGGIVRLCSIWQCRLNGIFLKKKQFWFYENDTKKAESIIKASPLMVLEDKPCVIEQLTSAGIKVLCVSGTHNREIQPSAQIEILHSFEKKAVETKTEKLLGRNNWSCHKREAASARFWGRIICAAIPIRMLFHPTILHPENQIHDRNRGTIYAPNHRSTLDPLIIESILAENIHWAALSRFFRGEDSIFNNSKNPLLCKITKYMFQKLDYFPIDRKQDDSRANNIASIKDMSLFLSNGYQIGIFAEGTTKRAAGQEFGHFDNVFLRLAEKYDAWVQPITLLWTEQKKAKSKVIVNFGEPFQILDGDIEKAMEHFQKIQKKCLEENTMTWERMSGGKHRGT